MTVERETVDLGPFEFECGESIPTLRVAFEAYGDASNPTILVCHALTGSQHVAGRDSDGETSGQAAAWWDDVVGPGKAIDTTEYHVVCANVPGSCYGTSGPESEDPETGEPYGPEFPAVTVGDWTRSQRRLLDELGIDQLRAVVGGSVGGMNVLEWARRFPDDVDLVVPVATAASLDPQCLGLDAVARRAITSDPNWNGGNYYEKGHPDPDHGLALARQLGHIMYLSKESMDRKFGRRTAGRDSGGQSLAPEDPATDFFPYRDVESYLDYQASQFVGRFDANSYLLLTRAMDDYDLARGCRSPAHALAGFDGEALLISFTGDWHFTVEQSTALAKSFQTANVPTAHRIVESDHGHDAFLVEPETFGPVLADFLAEGVDGDAVSDARLPPDRESYAPVHTSLFS